MKLVHHDQTGFIKSCSASDSLRCQTLSRIQVFKVLFVTYSIIQNIISSEM